MIGEPERQVGQQDGAGGEVGREEQADPGAVGQAPPAAGQEVGVTNSLTAGTSTLPGTAIGFCYELSLPSGSATTLQGKAATVTWGVTATSS